MDVVCGTIVNVIFSCCINNLLVFSFSLTEDIIKKLSIDGYHIEFPASWEKHGVARVLVFVSDEIRAVRQELSPDDSDLQSVTLQIGLGREKLVRAALIMFRGFNTLELTFCVEFIITLLREMLKSSTLSIILFLLLDLMCM